MSETDELTTRLGWLAIVTRQFELGEDQLRRRAYSRKHKRCDLEFGWATMELDKPRSRPEQLTILELSPDGLMLRAYDCLPIGASMTLRVAIGDDEAVLRAVVRHVTQTLGGYKVGVELDFTN